MFYVRTTFVEILLISEVLFRMSVLKTDIVWEQEPVKSFSTGSNEWLWMIGVHVKHSEFITSATLAEQQFTSKLGENPDLKTGVWI